MDLTIAQMMQMRKILHKLHENEWSPIEPEHGRNCILHMIEEIGETISILKKKGDRAVVENAAVRAAFLEEMVLYGYTAAIPCVPRRNISGISEQTQAQFEPQLYTRIQGEI